MFLCLVSWFWFGGAVNQIRLSISLFAGRLVEGKLTFTSGTYLSIIIDGRRNWIIVLYIYSTWIRLHANKESIRQVAARASYRIRHTVSNNELELISSIIKNIVLTTIKKKPLNRALDETEQRRVEFERNEWKSNSEYRRELMFKHLNLRLGVQCAVKRFIDILRNV